MKNNKLELGYEIDLKDHMFHCTVRCHNFRLLTPTDIQVGQRLSECVLYVNIRHATHKGYCISFSVSASKFGKLQQLSDLR